MGEVHKDKSYQVKIEVTSSTAVYEDLKLATVNDGVILVEEGATMNEEVEGTVMDDGHKQINETEVSVESCEIRIPAEAGKDNESVHVYQCFLYVECQTEVR